MKVFKQLRFYLILILVVSLGYLAYQADVFGMPDKYLILLVLAFITIFTFVSSIAYQRNKIIQKIGIVLMVITIGASAYGNTVASQVHDTLKAMEKNAEEKNVVGYSVIVNKVYDTENGESVPRLQSHKNKAYAVLETGNTTFNRDVIALVREELGEKIDIIGIRTIEEAESKLKNDEIQMLIMNEGTRDLFSESLDNFTTTVKTWEFENDKELIRNPAKVTQEPFIVYISGIDLYGSLSYVSRSDVNKVVIINPLSKDVLMIDIPRDYYVPLACFYDEYDKLTHSGIYGVDCTLNTVANFLDIDINYYARINFSTFIEVIDAIGGVDVTIDEGFCASEDAGGFCYKEGNQTLYGWQALCFARERQTLPGGDNDRIKNQSKLLKAIIDKVASPSILNNYSDLLKILAKNIETNMSTQDMISLVQMQLSDMAEWSINSYALDGWGTYANSAVMGQELYMSIPDDESVAEAKALIDDIIHRVY